MTGRKHRYNMEVVAPRHRQHRLRHLRRHQRHRHDRAHCDQYSRRRVQPGLRHGACRLRAGVHARCGAPCELHPAVDQLAASLCAARTGGRGYRYVRKFASEKLSLKIALGREAESAACQVAETCDSFPVEPPRFIGRVSMRTITASAARKLGKFLTRDFREIFGPSA